MPPDTTREELQRLIRNALEVAYTSHSCQDNIATGNKYQTVTLGGEELGGFRASRADVLSAFDFANANVLDIGSNLGELSRATAKLGAAKVTGLEYDAYFALLAGLVTLENGLQNQVRFVQGDVTKAFQFDSTWDYILAFSVFTYIGKRIPEIANATAKALIVETHNIEGDGAKHYRSTLSNSFPRVVTIGDSDWGTASQFQGGRRLLMACFKSHALMWDFFLRCQMQKPNLSSLVEVDIEASSIPALSELKSKGKGYLDKALALDEGAIGHEALGISPPTSLGSLSYWVDFWRGSKHFEQAGRLLDTNPYLQMMRRLVAEGTMFDPGAMIPMRTENILLERVERRLKAFTEGERRPCLFLADSGKEPSITLVHSRGESKVTDIDGYHRLATAYLNGEATYAGYDFHITQSEK